MGETNKYDNLDFCLNLHYDAIYNKKTDNNYKIGNINRKNVGLNDLKKVATFDSSFVLGGGNLQYIGYFNDRFHFKRKSHTGGFPCELAFGIYPELSDNTLNRGVLFNVGIMYIISELIYVENFRHSVLPVMLFDVNSSAITNIVSNFKEYVKDANIEPDKLKHANMYCLVTEHYFKMPTLKKYLRKHGNSLSSDQWRSIFWQLLYALSKLYEKFREFRHNKLNLDSVRLYIQNEAEQTYFIGNEKFVILNNGFELKIYDYDYATTKDYIDNVTMQNVIDNPYYDVHYFFNSLYILLLKWQFTNVPKDIIIFIRGIVPDAMLITDQPFNGLNETNKEYEKLPAEWSIPSMIIKKNKFFETYRTPAVLTLQGGQYPNIFDIATKQFSSSQNKLNSFDIRSLTESSVSNPRMLAKNTNIKNKNPHINNINMDMETGKNKLNSLERAEIAQKRKNKSRKSKKSKTSSSSVSSSSEAGTNDKIYEQYIQTMKEMGHRKNSSSESSEEPKHRSKSRKKRSHKHKRSRSGKTKQSGEFSAFINEKINKLPFDYVDEFPSELAMAMEAQNGEHSRSSRRYQSEMARYMDPLMQQYMQQYSTGNPYQQMPQQMPPQMIPQMPQQMPPQMQFQQYQQYPTMPQQVPMNTPSFKSDEPQPPTQGGGGKTYKLNDQQFFF